MRSSCFTILIPAIMLFFSSVLFPITMAVSSVEEGEIAPRILMDRGPPTRVIVQESENNNGWSSADQVPISSGNRVELHGNLSSSSDYDFFYVSMNGGSGPVDTITITPTYIDADNENEMFVLWFWGFYPSDDLNSPDEIPLTLGIWLAHPAYWYSVSISASYTGNYGFIVRPVQSLSGNLEYNFTVSMTSITPPDPYNDQAGSMELNSGRNSLLSQGLNVETDLFDWYHFKAPHPIHPTLLDLTLSLTSVSPNYNDGQFDWNVEVDMFILYNSRSSPNVFQKQSYRVSTSSFFQNDGCSPSPLNVKIEKNCTEMYIGMYIQSLGIDSRGQRSYGTSTGSATYNLLADISGNIPNNRPQLLNARVEPSKGWSSTMFTFSVLYRDVNNETPASIDLWLDGEPFRKLSRMDGEGLDHVEGVVYSADVLGSQIGRDAYHNFNFSATDGRDRVLGKESGLRLINGPLIDDNLPPQSDVGDGAVVTVLEDSPEIWVNLETFFSDPDPGTVFTYRVLDEDGEWNYKYRDTNLKAEIVNNGTEEEPEYRMKVYLEPDVNGIYTLRLNATDNSFFPRYVETDLIFEVIPVNDPPEIKRVGSVNVELFDKVDFYKEQGEMVEITIVAVDLDGEDELKYEWDIGDRLSHGVKDETYGWDEETGDLWFRTTDGDVPGFETTLVVTDGNGGRDSVTLVFDIENLNDPPTISLPAFRSTIEGEYLYLNPVSNDPDLDSGDIITFSYNLGSLDAHTPSSAIEFSQSTGRLVLKAVSDEMNGDWEINITVVDLEGKSDFAVTSVKIENVNDAPIAFPINVEQRDENLTVTFHTTEAEDDDEGDVHTYIWDFGDGSDPLSDVEMRDVTHTFLSAGAYTVTLRVYDGELYSETRELIVTVTAPPPNPDMDGDGMLDSWEMEFGLDPSDPEDTELDYDEDGLTNLQEFEYFMDKEVYLNPRDPDTDRDGFKDGEEVEMGFDPLSKDSHPADEGETWNMLLWIGAVVSILLMVLAAVAAFITWRRGRPRAVATPAFIPAPVAVTDHPLMEGGTYQTLPGQDVRNLPPARYDDDGTYGQEAYPGDYDQQQYPDRYPQDGLYGQEGYPGSTGDGEHDMIPSPDNFDQGPDPFGLPTDAEYEDGTVPIVDPFTGQATPSTEEYGSQDEMGPDVMEGGPQPPGGTSSPEPYPQTLEAGTPVPEGSIDDVPEKASGHLPPPPDLPEV